MLSPVVCGLPVFLLLVGVCLHLEPRLLPAPGEVTTCSVAHLSSPLSPLSVALTLWTLRLFFTRVLEKFWEESKIHIFNCHVSVIFLNLSVLTVGTGSSMETTFADGSEIQVCN